MSEWPRDPESRLRTIDDMITKILLLGNTM